MSANGDISYFFTPFVVKCLQREGIRRSVHPHFEMILMSSSLQTRKDGSCKLYLHTEQYGIRMEFYLTAYSK